MGNTAAERFDKLLKPWLADTGGVGKMLASGDDSDTRPAGFEPATLGSEVCLTVSPSMITREGFRIPLAFHEYRVDVGIRAKRATWAVE